MADKKHKAEKLAPSKGYRTAVYALQCGDSSIAEQYARNQPRQARCIYEYVQILEKLGYLSPAGISGLGFATEQLQLTERTVQPYTRLGFAQQRLASAGHSGLRIWTLVSDIGQEEGADFRNPKWRAPVAAELNEHVDRGDLVAVDNGTNDERLYHPAYAPTK